MTDWLSFGFLKSTHFSATRRAPPSTLFPSEYGLRSCILHRVLCAVPSDPPARHNAALHCKQDMDAKYMDDMTEPKDALDIILRASLLNLNEEDNYAYPDFSMKQIPNSFLYHPGTVPPSAKRLSQANASTFILPPATGWCITTSPPPPPTPLCGGALPTPAWDGRRGAEAALESIGTALPLSHSRAIFSPAVRQPNRLPLNPPSPPHT